MKVLLIAARDEFSEQLATKLMHEGAHVTHVPTGAEALTAAIDGFDLIALAVDLPDADAFMVLRQLRGGAAPMVPIVLLKGEGEPAHVVQRGLDFGASGYVIKHRLPGDLTAVGILGHLVKASNGRLDACPFSARHEFGRCSVFLPLSINLAEEGDEPAVSCSHLRIGTSDAWRLYPRCAIGDQAARDHYMEDKAPV